MSRFADRVALVTGGAGGIGRAVVERIGAEGGRIVVGDVDIEAATSVALAFGDRASAVALDVTDPASCAAAVATTTERFGRLDVLVNVAGVGSFAHTGGLSLEAWERTLRVNLTGTFLMCQLALPELLARRGAIVNVASVAGIRATPYNAAYCASKGGVIMLSKSLAVEFGKAGLRVNCVCPSAVDTAFLSGFDWPEGIDLSLFARAGSVLPGPIAPAEVASAIAYLASDDAASVTGTTLVLDGGATA